MSHFSPLAALNECDQLRPYNNATEGHYHDQIDNAVYHANFSKRITGLVGETATLEP